MGGERPLGKDAGRCWDGSWLMGPEGPGGGLGGTLTASGATVSCALCPLCGHLAQKIQTPVHGLQLPQQQHLCPPHKWQFRASQSPPPSGLQSAPHASSHPVSLSLLSCPTPNTLSSARTSGQDLWGPRGLRARACPLHASMKWGAAPRPLRMGTWLMGIVPAMPPGWGGISGQASFQPPPAFCSPSHSDLGLLRPTSPVCLLIPLQRPSTHLCQPLSLATGKPQ